MTIRGHITIECDLCAGEILYDSYDLTNCPIIDCLLDDGWKEREGEYICDQCVEEGK